MALNEKLAILVRFRGIICSPTTSFEAKLILKWPAVLSSISFLSISYLLNDGTTYFRDAKCQFNLQHARETYNRYTLANVANKCLIARTLHIMRY